MKVAVQIDELTRAPAMRMTNNRAAQANKAALAGLPRPDAPVGQGRLSVVAEATRSDSGFKERASLIAISESVKLRPSTVIFVEEPPPK